MVATVLIADCSTETRVLQYTNLTCPNFVGSLLCTSLWLRPCGKIEETSSFS